MELTRVRRAGAVGVGGGLRPGDGDRPAGRRTGRPHRTWPQRLLIAFNIIVVAVCLSSAWGLSFYQQQLASIPRIPLQGVLDRPGASDEPVNFLLVGSDSTGNDDPRAAENAERYGVFHADSISILRVDPDQQQAAMLSLPRDLWVDIPGIRGKSKINSSLTYANPPGNPQLLIQTIQDNFHIEINHYLQVDFAAFRNLVDELDGVNLWFDRPSRDAKTGLYIPEAGCRTVNGVEALAYARSRFFTIRQDDGVWVEDPTSDIGRIARQQYFMKQAAKKAIARGARNPIELSGLIGIAQRYLKIDDALTPQNILDVAGRFNAFNPDDLHVSQPYTERQFIGGGDGLRLLEAPSREIFDKFRDVDVTVNPEATVRLEVRNGGARLQAAAVQEALAARGFVVTSVGDNPRRPTTVVRHAPGGANLAAAILVARYLDLGGGIPAFEEDPELATATAPVVLVVGPDLTAVRTEARPLGDFTAVIDAARARGVDAASEPPASVPAAGPTTTVAAPAPTLPPPDAASFVPHPEGAC